MTVMWTEIKHLNETGNHASSITVCFYTTVSACFTRKQETLSRKWQTRGQRLDKGAVRGGGEKNSRVFFFFFIEAFCLRGIEGREAATPDRTYSSPPFSPCAPFCTAPWVWLSGPGPRPRPQKRDLARLSLHRGNKTRPRGCWRSALMGGPKGLAGWVKVQKPLRLILSWRIIKPQGEQQATITSVIIGSINNSSLLDFFCIGISKSGGRKVNVMLGILSFEHLDSESQNPQCNLFESVDMTQTLKTHMLKYKENINMTLNPFFMESKNKWGSKGIGLIWRHTEVEQTLWSQAGYGNAQWKRSQTMG